MNLPRRSKIPDEIVAARLEELGQIDRLMRALRDVRFVDGASEVRDGNASHEDSPSASSDAGPRAGEPPRKSDADR